MTDKIRFKIIDPRKKGETWAQSGGSPDELRAVEIYINGRELTEIVKEKEVPFAKAEGHPNLAGLYGHNTPKYLYKDLSEVFIEGSYSNKYGVSILCCEECGEPGCWGIDVKVRQDDDFVYWQDFEQAHRKNWKYDLNFKFDKPEYDSEIKKLKATPHKSKIKPTA